MIQVELLIKSFEQEFELNFSLDQCTTIEQENFVKLAQSGFYDNCPIFRIERSYLALSGDPTGTGKSGTQSYFDLAQQQPSSSNRTEKDKKPVECKRGSLGLLRDSKSGKIGSQFFIMFSNSYPEMAKKHAIIGQTEDESGLANLEKVRCDFEGRPLMEVFCNSIIIRNSPFTNVLDLRRPKVEPPTSSKRELSETEKQIVERAYEAKLPIDLDQTLSTCTLYVGNLNPNSDSRELGDLLESKLKCKLKKYTNKVHYAFLEFYSLEECDQAYARLKNVVIDDFKVKADYHFPNLRQLSTTINSNANKKARAL